MDTCIGRPFALHCSVPNGFVGCAFVATADLPAHLELLTRDVADCLKVETSARPKLGAVVFISDALSWGIDV
jgi:hypothetical protein